MAKFANALKETGAKELSKKSLQSLATRQRLLVGATQAFENKGYHATRIADITDCAGVALGNFYRHFKNKNEIFTEVLRPVFEEMLLSSGRYADEKKARTIDALTTRNIRYIEYFDEHKKLFRAGYEAAASVTSDQYFSIWFELREMFFARSRAWLAGLVRSGMLRDNIDINFMAEALGAMNEHFIYIRVIRMDEKPSQEEIETMARMLAEIWWLALFKEESPQTNKSEK